MSERQKTIKNEIVLSGTGLHTGNKVTMRLQPGAENTGIHFVRVDLVDKPVLKACLENVVLSANVPRCTSLGKGEVIIHTVEHLLSVLCGLGVDNLLVEIDANELPGLDGSGLEFLKAIQKTGIEEQPALKEYTEIKEPISVNNQQASLLVVPDTELRISYTLAYPHPFIPSQFFSATIDSDFFAKELAPCRTFCLEEEAQELKAHGLGKGANYQNTLVVGKKGVIQNTLRFPDELARHKVLDLLGDMYLLGKPIRGHIFAVMSGHHLNIELLKKIGAKQKAALEKKEAGPAPDLAAQFGDKTELDIHQIMKILPHRYPFLLVDRIVALEKGKRAVGIKNVTVNENFFTGHFPSRPVMPGVLMVEALAQVAGIVILTDETHQGKVSLFMAVDKVKFRRLVGPGDQLVLEAEMVRDRSRTALLLGRGKVGNDVVVEAELTFSFIDATFLDT